MRRNPKSTQQGNNVARKMTLEQPTADNALSRRLLEAEGPEALSLVKTLQARFGAKPLWYRDAQGEVGKNPRWPE